MLFCAAGADNMKSDDDRLGFEPGPDRLGMLAGLSGALADCDHEAKLAGYPPCTQPVLTL
jgi:hypothetical protein